jgi:tetratricopeptide (TPR) repeat protein
MSMSQQSLREELRRASDALSRADAAHLRAAAIVDNTYAQRGISDKQLKQLKQSLLDTARNNLATVRAAVLQSITAPGLPGLPTSQLVIPDDTLREGQFALAGAWRSLGEFEILQGDKTASIAAYGKAVAFAPNDAIANAQLADLLESSHNLADAKTHAEAALRTDPANFIAALALARVLLRQEKFADAERAALAATKAMRTGVDDQALAWSLVGEARDRLNQPAHAFKAFTRANQLMLRRYGAMQQQSHPAHPANVRSLTRFVERTRSAPSAATSEAPAPVFLIGFPRSGTTLLEQVLSSHPQTFCLGETDYLFEAMSTVLRDGDVFERVSALTAGEIETVRKAYQQIVLRDHPESAGLIIIDKHPLHIVLLPLINKFFPDAKIILTQRDPRDVVLSCYQQCFGINVATAQFLDLTSTADYFDAVMSLMLACRERLELDLHQVNYQDVVADLETEARRISDFLGIAFEPAMLHYDAHARTRTIASASARQVINPIYNRSIGRWRRYTRELAPVLPLLDKWARRLGYEE